MSSATTSPSTDVAGSSLPPISHSASHEPTSLQPMLTGTTAACGGMLHHRVVDRDCSGDAAKASRVESEELEVALGPVRGRLRHAATMAGWCRSISAR